MSKQFYHEDRKTRRAAEVGGAVAGREDSPKAKRERAERFPSKCAPGGIRIRVLALKGPRPGPLDDGGNGKILPAIKGLVKPAMKNTFSSR
jgi:hypothetical protein